MLLYFVVNSCFCYLEVVRVKLATDEVEALFNCRLACATASHVWVKHRAACWGDESAQVLHECGWFDCWVIVALVPILLACLGAVEKAGGRALGCGYVLWLGRSSALSIVRNVASSVVSPRWLPRLDRPALSLWKQLQHLLRAVVD